MTLSGKLTRRSFLSPFQKVSPRASTRSRSSSKSLSSRRRFLNLSGKAVLALGLGSFLPGCRIPGMPIGMGAGDLIYIGSHTSELMDAALLGPVEKIRGILRRNPGAIHETNELGQNALHIAVWHCDNETVLELIQAGVDIHKEDQNGFTPLNFALFRFHPWFRPPKKSVDYLLDAGANIHHVNREGATAIFYAAAASGREENPYVERLIQAGAKAMLTNQNGVTPFILTGVTLNLPQAQQIWAAVQKESKSPEEALAHVRAKDSEGYSAYRAVKERENTTEFVDDRIKPFLAFLEKIGAVGQ